LLTITTQLQLLAQETRKKAALMNKPYFGVRTKADLGDASKWGLADVHVFGQTMKHLVNDVDDLEVDRNRQFDALKTVESDMLKGQLLSV
jgi:nucleoporin NUP159